MPSSKKHRGLGRGLDALIPKAELDNTGTETEEKSTAEDNSIYKKEGRSAEDSSENERNSNDSGKTLNAGMVQMVRITKVEPDRTQPRKNFDPEKLQQLADSIQRKGLLEPILVQDRKTHYEIIAGERRWRACKLAGLKEIPVIVKSFDEAERVEVSLIENIQREDLNPIEEARAYERLIREFNLKQEEIAEKVSKDRSSIANSLRLLKLSEPVQDMVAEGKISMGHARALIPLEDPEQQLEIAERIAAENLSVREVERLIRNLSREEKKTGKTEDPSQTAIYHDIEGQMNSSLGMKVVIKPKGKKGGSLQIEFSNQDDLEKLMDRLIPQNG